MKQLLRCSRLFRIACVLVSLAFSLIALRPLLRFLRNGKIKDNIVPYHLRGICRVMGLRIHIRGDGFPQQNFLLLSNHLSYLDIIVLGSLHPMSFMAKEEIKSWPVIGFLAKKGSAVFVGRDSVLARLRALHGARRLLADQSICIFPEGTTSAAHSPGLSKWFRGNISLHKQHQLVCAGIHYREQDSLAWIDDQMLLPHLLEALGRKSIDVFVELKSVKASEELSLKGMSQLAHQTVCLLADNAYERAQLPLSFENAGARRRMKLSDSLYQIR
jgi:1-acyl-sn-glycerol-3-phosphate acyltransferase